MKNKKKLLIAVGSVLAAIGVAVGIMAAVAGSGKTPVYVYSYDIVGMGGYWEDSKQSYGPVRSDNIQTVMLSDTQTVTAVNVREGDTVKKDDILMTYDSTLSELALEKKRLAVEQLKLRLQQEKDRLKEINNLQPYVPPKKTYTWVESTGVNGFREGEVFIPNSTTDIRTWSGGTGTEETDAVILWMRNENTMTNDIFESVAQFLAKVRSYRADVAYKKLYDEYLKALEEWNTGGRKPEEKPQEPSAGKIQEYFLILKQTEGDDTASKAQVYFGMHASKGSGGVWSFVPFDASNIYDYTKTGIPGHTVVSGGEEESTDPVYTLEEIIKMREEQQKTILDVEYRIKVAQAEYSIAQRESQDGNVRAQVDGKVISVLTPEEAREKKQPMIKVSGGGGYYVTGTIGELERDKLSVGAQVTITDNRTGNICTGTVESIGDYPTDNDARGDDVNVSFYPFNVFVDESADLVGGNYVSINYSLEEENAGIYLTNAFVRKENGQNYVYVRGEGGKLAKRAVTVGKTVWGSYKQILSGASAEDLFAFPYGKNVKVGAATQDGDYTTLYGA